MTISKPQTGELGLFEPPFPELFLLAMTGKMGAS